MAHRSRVSPLPRILLLLILSVSSFFASSAQAQEVPATLQSLGGPGGRVTHLVTAPDGRDMYMVSAASVNRQNDQTQWRDTGVTMWSDALYGSRDAGASWQAVTNDLPPGAITALYTDSLARVWVGIRTRGGSMAARGGLWRSDDHGATWQEVFLDRDDLILRTIAEDAGQQMLLGAVDAGNLEPGVIYRSADDGAAWTGQDVSVPEDSGDMKLAGLVPHPAQTDVFFLLTTTGALLRSTDGGKTWLTGAESILDGVGSAQLAFPSGSLDDALLIQSHVTTTRVLRSADGGATWSELRAAGLPGGPLELRSVVALPGDVLLLNTDAGTYRSTDGGRRWQPLEGALSSGQVSAWAQQGNGGQRVLAASDYGLFASSDGGAVWRAYGEGQPVNSGISALLTHKDRPAMIVASLAAQGDVDPPELLLSRDAGRTWLPADGGDAWRNATAWAIDPGNPDHLYAAGQNFVAVSEDGGISWKLHAAPDTVRTMIAIAPSDGSHVYVDGAPALRSEDGGQTWKELPLEAHEGETANGLAVDPTDPRHLWSGAEDGIRESRDAGDSWQPFGLDEQPVRWVAVSSSETNKESVTVYAGLRDGGMMRRRADWSDWQPADSRMPPRSVIIAFAADPRTPGLLWAARDGGGVYRSTDGGDNWTNVGVGLGENLALALAVNFQAPGSVLLGTATAGLWALGSNGPAPRATETPAGSPTAVPGSRGGRSGVDARIEVLWPHDFAPVDQAQRANLGIRLFVPRSLQPPACGWQPEVQLWNAVDNEPAKLVARATQRNVDGQPFPYWEANDVDVSVARDGSRKIYFLLTVKGIDTATSVWAHAADARTYFPEQQVPSGLATGAADAVDARIQIVWPHDELGAEAGVGDASLANVAVTLFRHGTRLSVGADWHGKVTLYGAWNAEVARPFPTQATVSTRQAGVITYPVWEFNDVPVERAKDRNNKLYLWAVAEGVESHPTIWAHGADARTHFPDQDEPIQGCLP